jgi:hypothetical protein
VIEIQINAKQLKRLREAVSKSKKSIKKELAGAINATSKKTKLQVGRDIRKTVNLKKDEAERPLSLRATATETNLVAVVSLKKTKRLGLRHFGAKQDNRGVSYKISKAGGRSRINGAFQGPKPGVIKMSWKGNVFVRVGPAQKMTKGRYAGKMRQPIQQRFGVSAFGAYAKNDLEGPQVKEINKELSKQMERRINLNILRANGLVKK